MWSLIYLYSLHGTILPHTINLVYTTKLSSITKQRNGTDRQSCRDSTLPKGVLFIVPAIWLITLTSVADATQGQF
jgi:hypothetical protein